MDFDPAELDALSREDLILRARARGVERPEQMTRVELRDEIVRVSEPDLERQRRTRGWLGVARDLLASVVESGLGLNLPDAAAAIRGDAKSEIDLQGPPPVATVTLAEIYAAQGHYEQALRMLEEVIEREPEHNAARALLQRLTDERDLGPGKRKRVVPTTTATPGPPQVAPAPPEASAAEVAAAAAAEKAAAEKAASEKAAAAAAAEKAAAEKAAAEKAAAAAKAANAEKAEMAAAEKLAAERAAAEKVATAAKAAAAEKAAAAQKAEAAAAEKAAAEKAAAEKPAPTHAQLVVLHTADRAFVYWRLPSVSETLRLRSVTVRPSVSGPHVAEEDHRLPLPAGGFWLARFEQGTEVRAVLGELSSDGFTPVTVARVLSDEPDASFEPPGIAVDAELEATARSAAGL